MLTCVNSSFKKVKCLFLCEKRFLHAATMQRRNVLCMHVCACRCMWVQQGKPRAGADSRTWGLYSASNSRHSRVTGRSNTDVLVLRRTRRTCPLESAIVSVMRPMSHEFLGDASSTTRTRSPTVKFLRGFCHFWRFCIIVSYSLTHLFQNMSVIYCTCLHLLRVYESSFMNKPGGIIGLPLSCRM